MKIDILTLFPDAFSALNTSILARARENGIININLIDFREFSDNKHKKVDDYSFGGGEGMLIKPQPLFDAILSTKTEKSKIVYLSPCGKPFSNSMAKELSTNEHLILICGHYEGIDQRVIDTFVDEEISIGDYVLTCGEIPAMVLVDALSRYIPGVLHNEDSANKDSFENYLLEQPQYTRPAEFRGLSVPDILLSGDHQKIEDWRQAQREERTKKVRPDLYEKYLQSKNKE
jgi:tRNA (guanine37-N1)-methyltransferase